MKEGKLNILIGGPAGAGIEKSGKLLCLSFVRGGYHVFANTEHMSQIRGGNNFLRIRVDKEKANECHVEEVDVIMALDKKTVEEHLGEVVAGGVVIFDGAVVGLDEEFENKVPAGVTLMDLPLKKTAEDELGSAVMANVIGLGALCGLIGFDAKVLKATLEKIFGHKGAEIVSKNNKAVDLGVKLASDAGVNFPVNIPALEPLNKMFLMGNDALAMGAVKAGVKFIGEYPMTPSSTILHFMAQWAEEYGIVVKHVEDEIAACNSVIGAGFAGARSMCATSGGGFALMTEAVGLASMNEVPIVVINVMRPGPATGQPTRTEAGDLRQVIHGGQGDPVKIVLLPADAEECFRMGFDAFNLAEKYQLPVIVCYDKAIGEGWYTVSAFNDEKLKVDRGKLLGDKEVGEDYKRYLLTEDGVSPRAIPGLQGGIHRATSDEHNEYGEILEDAENRRLMVEKRARKLSCALAELPGPELIGNGDAEVTFVTWCSCKGACLEACELLREQGISANIVQIKTAWPFHKKETVALLGRCKRLVLVEQNYDGQMGGLIAENTGILIEERILRYDGRPMTGKYVVDKLEL